jgi:AsmA protein
VKAVIPERKKGLIIAGGVVVLIIIAGTVAALLLNINSYKSKIEIAASEATGLDVRINGKMGLSFFPLGVSARNIHVTIEGAELLSLESLQVGVKLMPLLKRRLEVTRCVLVKPAVTIVRNAEGKYNFESLERKLEEGPRIAFSLKDLKLSEGTLVYLDKKTSEKAELKGIDLAVKNLSVADTAREMIKNVSFTGSFDCEEILRKDLKIENLKGLVKADKGVYSLKPLTMDVIGGKGEGEVTADESEAVATYEVNVKVSKLDFEILEESFGIKKVIGGKGEFSASLTAKEKGHRNLMSDLDGTFSLRGDNLVTYTMDLDKVLSTYASSQKFHLVDLGAYFIVGPLGAVALKGYRYGDLYYQAQGGKGTITQFISHWKIENGEAEATDCALATHHNRVALKGKLDLVGERFDNVTVALLDDAGCAIFKQGVSGSFGSPRVGTVSAVESLAGPFLDLYRKAKRFVQGGKCEVSIAVPCNNLADTLLVQRRTSLRTLPKVVFTTRVARMMT